MKKKLISYKLLVMGLWFFLCVKAYAQSITSTELINHAREYDGKPVVYTGEVIGEVMVRGQYAWVNVHDGNNAIGIWMDASLAREIRYAGSYRAKGDIVEINGIFQRACTAHGGDLDIHAQGVQRKIAGREIAARLNPAKRNMAITLLGVLGLVWILSLLKQK